MRRDVLLGLLVAALLTGPAWMAGGLAGSPGAEVYGHAWVLGWAADAWPAWPTGTSLAVGAASWPVIDPLPTWILAGVARVVGVPAAWNLGYAGWVVLTAAGGGALARALGGVGWVGALGLALSPIWLGSLTSGLTEDGALGLLAFTLAAAVEGRWIRAGLLVGASCWCGLYLGWLGGLALLATGAWKLGGALLGGPEGRTGWGHLLRTALVGLVLGALVGGPALLPFRARLAGEGHRHGTPPLVEEPLWPLNPWRRADAASFVHPGDVALDGALVREHPTYPGFLTVLLAVSAGPSPAWLGVGASALTSLGDHLYVAGEPRGVNPLYALWRWIPGAQSVNHHARLWLLGQVLLVGLAARGARRRKRWGVLMIGELILGAPSRVPLPTTPAASPEIYGALEALPAGPLVVLGAAGPGIPPQKVFFDQRAHGRPLLHNPNAPGPIAPRPGAVLVALDAWVPAAEAAYGPPDVVRTDGAAWWLPPEQKGR